MYDDLTDLVDEMLQLNNDLGALPKAEAAHIHALEKQIEHKDKLIDSLVYKLYGLTEDEIKVVQSRVT